VQRAAADAHRTGAAGATATLSAIATFDQSPIASAAATA
jgi:hypothetical protein